MMTDRRMKEMSELIATLQYEIQAPHDSSVERILALMRDEKVAGVILAPTLQSSESFHDSV